MGALDWGARSGFEQVISFDMGGTSTDVSLCPGRLLHTREFEIAGQPVALPVIDIHTVGAGGGSIARVDPGGALRVGPESAGADPGPICYGRGGQAVTVTDAHVWLGRLPAEAFLGGEVRLRRELVQPSLTALAEQLGATLEDTAEGVLEVCDSAMERALRVISVERGYDPEEFIVVAFGGAGALHVAELADRMGAARALVPPDPGLLSAYGMLAAPLTREASLTVLLANDLEGYRQRIAAALQEMEAVVVPALLEEGADPSHTTVERWVDARYRGQSFELRIPIERWETESPESRAEEEAAREGWETRFHRAHELRYGYSREETPVEAVTLRVVARAPGPTLEAASLDEADAPPPAALGRVRYHREAIETPQVWRRDLRAGHALSGPLLVLEYSATTWVPPGWRMEVDPWGSLHLRRSA